MLTHPRASLVSTSDRLLASMLVDRPARQHSDAVRVLWRRLLPKPSATMERRITPEERSGMFFLQTNWILAFVFMSTFYGMGKSEARFGPGRDNSMLWAGLSIGVSAIVIQLFSGGWILVAIQPDAVEG